ncbi:unnamed protein product [Caenorhabditis auriculariae]|uniref:C-type lectin domain-containing protein n=1 Tax=Caenorhabditis auriculariae TaxID=2777116 RepID=A0A8S1HRC5_9PELO|nr:unnamed protein product [Caenorhabditis auriculariae]
MGIYGLLPSLASRVLVEAECGGCGKACHPYVATQPLPIGLCVVERCHVGNRCPDDTWKMFARTGGRFWCMKYNDGRLTRDDAEKACQAQNGTLTGFENEEEFAYIRDTAFEAFKKFNLSDGGSYWLDGIRSPNCHGPNNNNCTRLNAFQWSNNLTQGTFAFTKWFAAEPNNSTLIYNLPDLLGLIADIKCSQIDVRPGLYPVAAIYGYFCGASAKKIGSKNDDGDCSSEKDGRGRNRRKPGHHSSEERRRPGHHSSEKKRRPGHHSSEERRRPGHHPSKEGRRPRHDSSREIKRHPTPEKIKARS